MPQKKHKPGEIVAKLRQVDVSVSEADPAAVDAALERLRIRDLAFRGLGEVSGGQRQLVALAQTIVRDRDPSCLREGCPP